MVTLEVKKREEKSRLGLLRSEGRIPAVFYGPKQDATSVSVSYNDFDKVFKSAGESTVVSLTGELGDHDVLIHDVVRDPLTNRFSHIDFYVMEKGKKVRVNVPVEFIGHSPAVKEKGAILVKVMHEIEIEALPKDLPHKVDADVSKLVDLDSQVVASDIVMPQGVSLVAKPEEIIAIVTMPKEEKEEVPVDLSTIEVEKKGKEVDPEEAEADSAKKE